MESQGQPNNPAFADKSEGLGSCEGALCFPRPPNVSTPKMFVDVFFLFFSYLFFFLRGVLRCFRSVLFFSYPGRHPQLLAKLSIIFDSFLLQNWATILRTYILFTYIYSASLCCANCRAGWNKTTS